MKPIKFASIQDAMDGASLFDGQPMNVGNFLDFFGGVLVLLLKWHLTLFLCSDKLPIGDLVQGRSVNKPLRALTTRGYG